MPIYPGQPVITTVPVAPDLGGTGIANPAPDTLTLGAPLSIDVSGAATDDVLVFNGAQWIPGNALTISGGPGVEFFDATPNVIATGANNTLSVNTLSSVPVVTAEQTITGQGIGAGTNVAFAAWLAPAAMGRTTINSGVWQFENYVGVDLAGGTTTITQNVYAVNPDVIDTVTVAGVGVARTATASGGTPFAVANITASVIASDAAYLQTPSGLYQISARISDTVVTIAVPVGYANENAVAFSTWQKLLGATSADINAITPTYTLTDMTTTQASFVVALTTKLGQISFTANTNAARVLTYVYNGAAHNSHFSTPLITKHNDLAGLQGGTVSEQYHFTAADYAARALLNTAQTFTAAQRGAVSVLNSASGSIAVNFALANNFSHTTTEVTVLANPSNQVAGQSGVIVITQGNPVRTLTYSSDWKWPGGTAGVLTATVGAIDIISYAVESNGVIAATMTNDVK